MLYALIGILFLFADQLLKFWTVSHIELNAYPGKELIPGVLNMTYIKNSGIAFGLFSKFSGLRWVLLGLLAAFTVFIVLGIILRYLRTGFARFTGTMLLAGLLGNGIDRAIYGYVVDMFEPKLGSITWPIFNLADCLVVVFGILFCIAVIAGGLGAPDQDWDDEDEEEEEEEEPPRRRSRRFRDEDEEESETRRRPAVSVMRTRRRVKPAVGPAVSATRMRTRAKPAVGPAVSAMRTRMRAKPAAGPAVSATRTRRSTPAVGPDLPERKRTLPCAVGPGRPVPMTKT